MTITDTIPTSAGQSAREIIFIVSNVADYQTLIDGAKPDTEVHVLDAAQDGMAQIAGILAGHSGIDAIHIFSHGSEGSVNLGTLTLTADNLPDHIAKLATIGAALTAEADILLYGCDVGKGSAGAAFVDALAQATQADIAASEDLTGNIAKGGNWVLETTSGVIDSRAFYAKAFEGTLADVTIGTLSTPAASTNSDGAHDIGQSFSATKTGVLTSIRVASNNNDTGANWTLKIYQGEGTGGTLLHTQTGASIGATVTNLSTYTLATITLDATVNITNGQTYTFVFSPGETVDFLYSNANPFPGGQMFSADAGGTGGLADIPTYDMIFEVVQGDAGPAAPGTPDMTAGTDSGISSTDNITNDSTPTYTISGSTNNSTTVTLFNDANGNGAVDSGESLGTAAGNGGVVTITASTLVNGTYNIKSIQTDASGTSTASSALSVTIDTTAPNAPSAPDMTAGTDSGSSNTDNTTSDTTPTFTGTAEAGSTVTLYDTDGTTSLGSATATGGNWSITASTLSAGAHTVTAKATDAAGNVSVASGGLALTIDAAAPAAPSTPDMTAGTDSGSSNTDNTTSNTTPTFTGTAEANATVTLISSVNGTVGTATADGSGNWSITASTLNSGAHTITATATDTAGNVSSASSGLSVTIDAMAPALTVGSVDISADTGTSNSDFLTQTASQTITGTLSGTLAAGDILYGSVDNGSTWTNITSKVSGTSISWDGATLSGSSSILFKITDAAGNDSATTGGQAYVLDTTAPSITAVSIPNSTMKVGATVTATITVADDGGSTYTLGGSTIGGFTLGSLARTNSTTYTAQFTVTEGGTDVAAGSDIPVSLVLTDPAGNSNTAYTTAIGQAGDAINAHSPTDIALSNNSVATIAGTNAVVGALSSTDATTGEAFTYTLVAGTGDTNNGLFNIDSGNLRANNASGLTAGNSYSVRVRTTDAAGNTYEEAVTVSAVVGPAIASATYDASTGVLSVTGSLMEAKTGAANDIAVNKLTLTGEGGTTYTLTSSDVEITSATTFSVTLNATDQAAVHPILNKNGTASTGGTTFNLAAADDWNANVTTGDTSDATNAVSVSNVPAPTISSATYDASTGALVLTGTGFLALSGATNDIVANKFTFTGEGGTTYTLTDTANVEITSGTAATLTLSATDKAAVNQIVNKNGTSATSGTTYNIAAVEDWAAGADAAVVVADLTGNGITVSNVAVPALTSATYDASTGALVLTGTGFLTLSGATNDIVANKFTFTGEGGTTYTLTNTANVEITSGTAATLTLSATDKAAVNQIVNKNGTSSTGGTTYNIAAAEDWAAGAAAGVTDVDATGNGITASNVAVPTITSATYDGATGQLVVTGTGFLKLSGATNDIDISKLSIAGDSTSYTLTSSSVEITSGTSFTVTLNATDINALKTRLNKDGTSSQGNTTYNLAAAEDWATGADAAVVVADLTGNGITATLNAAPIITSNSGGETAAINVAENSTAVTTVTATDANSDPVTFSITGGADQAKFAINANTGVLSFIAAPNFEAPTDADTNNSYIVAVTANDSNGGADVQTITVNVTDVNETPAPAPDPAPTPVQTAPVTSEALETIPLTGTQTTTTTTQTDPNTGAPQTVATNNFVGTATVDGMAVNGVTTTQTITTTNPSTGQTSTVTVQNSTLTVPIVPNNRTEEDKVSTNADIPLAQAANGERLIQASLPVGVGLTADGVNDPRLTLRELLINAAEPRSDASSFTDIQNQIDNFVPGVNDQSQVTVRTLTFQSNPNNPTPRNEPIVITGANGTGESDVNHPNRQEALVIDVRNLPAGTKLILDNVEFAIIIGATRVTGGNGKNIAVGDNAAQYMVLGADDDVLHGGGGDDIIGSRGGDDLINGDAGNDWLVGGVGNDMVNGGEGNDLLHGGASDAGTYRFTLNETGKVRLDWTATHAEMAVLPAGTIDGQWWHADGQAQIIDPRFAFVTADGAYLQDVAALYQAVLKQLPNVADLNAWVASGKTQAELVQIAWDAYQSLQGPVAQALEVQLAQLIQSVWGGTADPALVQAGVNHINQGGSWGDALLYLARHANNTQAITDTEGRIKLAKDWTLKEAGWSGEGGNDQLFGGAGNDVLVAGSGNNVLDGGVGTDLAVFFGHVNEWQIALNDAQQIVVSNRHNGAQNIIRDIELLQFGDTIFGQVKPDHPVVVTGVQYAMTDFFTPASTAQIAMIGISDWTTA